MQIPPSHTSFIKDEEASPDQDKQGRISASASDSGQKSQVTNFSLTKQLRMLEGDKFVEPKLYQQQIFQEIVRQWSPSPNESESSIKATEQPERFGSIVFMPTGSGKTLIAVMLILHIFKLYEPQLDSDNADGGWNLKRLGEEELAAKSTEIQADQLTKHTAKVAFIVPTTNLVEQQADAINQITPLRVGKYSGNHQKSQKQTAGQKQYDNWQNQLLKFDVFVFTQKKLYDILMHGLMKVDEFQLIVFDECHHTDQSHYYNLIMHDFFFYRYSENKHTRPRILGLTASPLKSKVGDSTNENITEEIKTKLQTLSNNLYSKYVCISERYINELEKNQARVRVEQYKFDLEEKIDQVNLVASNLIKKLLRLIPLDPQSMKINDPVGQRIVSSDDPCMESRLAVENMDIDE